MKKKIFAFDLGKTSIGYCIREENDIQEANSIIISSDHADISSQKDRRKIKRTLEAHKSREQFLEEIWQKCNLSILPKSDQKFKKEFSSKNENTIYTSCLLRIALLQNKPLENWQIYKALHNAIQRRGYDANLPWKTIQTDDDKKNIELLKRYTQKDGVELINNQEYQYACYYDALRLGLWEEGQPNILKKQIPFNNFNKVRNVEFVAPRNLIEKELEKLWHNAQKQLPQLQAISAEEFMYGNYREAYGSYKNPDLKKFMGKKEDWTGVLGQKIPRFNNRIISKCRLLPKRNVCKAETLESVSFALLMKLKNLRLTDIYGDKFRLNCEQINAIYENWLTKSNEKEKNKLDTTITKKEIEAIIDRKIIDKIEPLKANTSGRSSFCRRACQIMNNIILNGIEPQDLNIEEFCDKPDVQDAITPQEIEAMLSKFSTWDNIYVSDNRDEERYFENICQETDRVIGSITNTIVKNRLQIFRNLLFTLVEKHGIADEIIIEFPREDTLYGAKKQKFYEDKIKEGKKENDDIANKLKECNVFNSTNMEKMKLLEKQGGKCIYSGIPIGINNLDECEIDHIFPRTFNGNDALYNKVLCYRIQNSLKKGRTPYEWLYNTDKWDEYIARLNGLFIQNKNNKKNSTENIKFQLLTSPPELCCELIDNYNALAETGYIARLAQQICATVFGWKLNGKDEKRHLFISNGRSTSQIRKRYKLNSLLGNDFEKNRANDKHHALDAICISYSREFKNNKICNFPIEQVKNTISEITPIPYSHKKPLKKNTNPLETIYGKRVYNDVSYITNRVDIASIENNEKKIKNIVDKVIKEDLLEKTKQINDKKEWAKMISDYYHPTKKTKVKKVMLIESEGNLTVDSNGRERIGEFCDFGNKGTKGQFKHSKGHKGQILYFDEKQNIKVMPIFANKNTKEAKDHLIKEGYKLYQNGFVFYSGILVEIPNDFKAGKETCPKGIYKLRTIINTGQTKLENNSGIEIVTSVKYLTEANFKKAELDF